MHISLTLKQMSGFLAWVIFILYKSFVFFIRNCFFAKSLSSTCVHWRKHASRPAQDDSASCSPFVGPSVQSTAHPFTHPLSLALFRTLTKTRWALCLISSLCSRIRVFFKACSCFVVHNATQPTHAHAYTQTHTPSSPGGRAHTRRLCVFKHLNVKSNA